MEVLHWFWDKEAISDGCNSSSLALIPNTLNPGRLGDFRPISLIGIFYKILAKILTERLKGVINKLISKVQSAFIKGRHILDGFS